MMKCGLRASAWLICAGISVASVPALAQVTPVLSDGTPVIGKLVKYNIANPATVALMTTADFSVRIAGLAVGCDGTVTSGVCAAAAHVLVATGGVFSCTFDSGGASGGDPVVMSLITNGACADGTGRSNMHSAGVVQANVAASAAGQVKLFDNRPIVAPVFPPVTLTASGNIELNQGSATSQCNLGTFLYNSGSAGTLTIQADATPGCTGSVVQMGAGQATIAVSGGTFNSNSACTTHPRTTGQGSKIGIEIQSNAGSAPVVIVFGDCG